MVEERTAYDDQMRGWCHPAAVAAAKAQLTKTGEDPRERAERLSLTGVIATTAPAIHVALERDPGLPRPWAERVLAIAFQRRGEILDKQAGEVPSGSRWTSLCLAEEAREIAVAIRSHRIWPGRR